MSTSLVTRNGFVYFRPLVTKEKTPRKLSGGLLHANSGGGSGIRTHDEVAPLVGVSSSPRLSLLNSELS